MDVDKITLFGALKKRLSWLTQRQEILSENIANSDTPKYRAKDIEPFKFRDVLREQQIGQVNMERTNPLHLEGIRHRVTDFRTEVESKPWETAPNGNAVVLEEQMAKLNETQVKHKLTAELYKKQLAMLRMAIGK